MKIKILIRVIEGIIGLCIGIYWLLKPNDFSEPLILILGSIILLLEGILLIRKKNMEQLEMKAKISWIIICIIFLASSGSLIFLLVRAGYTTTNKVLSNELFISNNEKIAEGLDSIKSILNEVKTVKTEAEESKDTNRKLPPPHEVIEFMDTVAAKIWSWIKTILFWLVILFVIKWFLAAIILNFL